MIQHFSWQMALLRKPNWMLVTSITFPSILLTFTGDFSPWKWGRVFLLQISECIENILDIIRSLEKKQKNRQKQQHKGHQLSNRSLVLMLWCRFAVVYIQNIQKSKWYLSEVKNYSELLWGWKQQCKDQSVMKLQSCDIAVDHLNTCFSPVIFDWGAFAETQKNSSSYRYCESIRCSYKTLCGWIF